MGIITDFTHKYAKIGDDAINSGLDTAGKWMGVGEQLKQRYEDAARELNRSWVWDNREPISGEAKVVHPFQFLDYTPLRWIGVTRLPLTGARAVEGGVKVAKALSKVKAPKLPRTWKIPKKTIGAAGAIAGAKALKPLLTKTAKTSGNLGKKTLNLVKKNPKKTLLTGALASALLTQHGSRNSGDTNLETETAWIRRRKVSRRGWL